MKRMSVSISTSAEIELCAGAEFSYQRFYKLLNLREKEATRDISSSRYELESDFLGGFTPSFTAERATVRGH
jgi:hypothetical protein